MLNLTGFKKFERDSRLMKRILFLEQEWARAYPLVDLQKQLGWAHVWLITSGKRYTDMGRFLNNWFRRCQQDLERSNNSAGPIQMPKPYKEERPHESEVMTSDDIRKMREAIRDSKRPTFDIV